MSPRRYDQRLRAEAAEETRRRVLDALYERLKAEPSRPVSVDEIAQIARVARSTIYLIFGSRAGLFDALAAELFLSGEFALVEAAAANPNARESLRDGFLGGARMFAAHRDVFRVLTSMAQLDANAVGGAVQRLDAARAAGMARLAERLAAAGLLRAGHQRGGRRPRALAAHQLRQLRPALHGSRPVTGRRRRGADDDGRAQPLPLRPQTQREGAQDAEAAARAALCAIGANQVVIDGIAPECLRCDGMRVHAPTVRPIRPSRNRPDRLALTGRVARGNPPV